MTTIMFKKKNDFNLKLDKYVLDELMNNDDFSQRVDQTYYSIILANIDKSNYILNFFSMQALDSDYFEYFYHNKNYTHAGEYQYDHNGIDFKWFNNECYGCKYFI